MNFRQLLPEGKISQETLLALGPVFDAERLFKENRARAAEVKYREGLENFPVGSAGRCMVYNKLGILYESEHRWDEATKAYEAAVHEGAITPFTYLRLGTLRLRKGSYAACLDACDRGVNCLKAAHTNLLQEAYFWLGLKRVKRQATRCLAGDEPPP